MLKFIFKIILNNYNHKKILKLMNPQDTRGKFIIPKNIVVINSSVLMSMLKLTTEF